jgi:hypothetical protein
MKQVDVKLMQFARVSGLRQLAFVKVKRRAQIHRCVVGREADALVLNSAYSIAALYYSLHPLNRRNGMLQLIRGQPEFRSRRAFVAMSRCQRICDGGADSIAGKYEEQR